MGAVNFDRPEYWNIVDGKLWRNDEKGPVRRTFTNSEGETKTYQGWWADGFAGVLVNMFVQQSDYGQVLRIKLRDKDQAGVISTKFSGGYACDFMKRMLNANLDLTKPIVIRPVRIKQDDKTKQYLVIDQNGLKIDSPYTKENPMPPEAEWKQVKVKGELKWDNSDHVEWLWNHVQERCMKEAQFEENQGSEYSELTQGAESPKEQAAAEDEFDDLPF